MIIAALTQSPFLQAATEWISIVREYTRPFVGGKYTCQDSRQLTQNWAAAASEVQLEWKIFSASFSIVIRLYMHFPLSHTFSHFTGQLIVHLLSRQCGRKFFSDSVVAHFQMLKRGFEWNNYNSTIRATFPTGSLMCMKMTQFARLFCNRMRWVSFNSENLNFPLVS